MNILSKQQLQCLQVIKLSLVAPIKSLFHKLSDNRKKTRNMESINPTINVANTVAVLKHSMRGHREHEEKRLVLAFLRQISDA